MEADTNTQASTIEVPPEGAHGVSPGIIDPSTPMMILTWITFLVLAFILSRVAWKPILKALELREKSIKRALADAEKARAEAADTEARNRESLQAAAAECRRMIDEARRAAQDQARQIQEQARAQAGAMVEEARREVQSSVESARLTLRREAGELAIALATKVTERNMDSERNRDLVRKLVEDMDRI